MRRAVSVAAAASALVVATMFVQAMGQASVAMAPEGKKFTLASAEIKHGARFAAAQVASDADCRGQNVSPGLTWSNAPPGTQSFTIQMYDADAPTGGGRWRWLVYNIPVTATSIPANAGVPQSRLLPAGSVQVSTDLGAMGYQGPCPPPGKVHRYFLRVVALKVPKLDVPKDATPTYIAAITGEQALGAAELIALYVR